MIDILRALGKVGAGIAKYLIPAAKIAAGAGAAAKTAGIIGFLAGGAVGSLGVLLGQYAIRKAITAAVG